MADKITLDFEVSPYFYTLKQWLDFYDFKNNNANNSNVTMSEFEFAYKMFKSGNYQFKYHTIDGEKFNTDKAQEMELRMIEIYNALMLNADQFEKSFLKDKYIETDYVKRTLNIY